MISIKDLRKEDEALAKALDLEPETVQALLDLVEKKKIPKPEKFFKDSMPKLNRKRKYPFTYLNLGQRQYFLLGDKIPLGSDLNKELQEAEKRLKKAKKEKKKIEQEQLKAFLELLEELPIKGYGTGIAKYKETVQNPETQEEEHLLAVKISSIEVGGKTKKATLADDVRAIDYEPRTKMGELVYLHNSEDDDQEEEDEMPSTIETNPKQADTPNVPPQEVKEKVQELLSAFKRIKPTQAYKGLGLIHQMRQWIDQLEDVPANFQKLLQQLEGQHEKLKPVLSTQIDERLDHSLAKVDALPLIDNTKTLDDLFGTVQKMYDGWKIFVPDETHPKEEDLEAIGQEIDWLKHYEQIIVPLREQYEEMEDSEEREALRLKINELIKEAQSKMTTHEH